MKPPYTSKMFLINMAHFDVSKTYKIKKKKLQTFYRLRTIFNCVLPIDTSPRDFSIMTLLQRAEHLQKLEQMQTECTCVTSKGAKLCNFLPASFLRQLFYSLEIILYLFLMGKSKMCNSYLPFLKRQLQLLHTRNLNILP